MMDSKDLNDWLKRNNLLMIKSTLDLNGVRNLDDFRVLQSMSDVIDFANDLGLTTIFRKKFVKAVCALIGVDTEEKKEECFSQRRGRRPARNVPMRQKFPPGINIVPCTSAEYRLPMKQVKNYSQQGLWQQAMNVYTTVKDRVSNTVTKSQVAEKLFADQNHKIILVCGKTGSGKSTLINSMMNYIYGVEFNDNFRLKLIVEKKKAGGDADSCTDHITSYRIKKAKGGNINYDLTIIDTPGFGDSRGLQRDMLILEEFKYVFSKVLTNVNGICFVVKSADNRLDALQTYVFNNILNLWAKDVANNIFILMTFADGSTANCTDALNKNDILKLCKRRLKVNNSAFTMDPTAKDFDPSDQMMQLFWQLGMKCFENFFRSLEEVKPQPIEKSKQVLRKRDHIKTKIWHVSMDLDSQLRNQQTINEERRFIKRHESEINAGKEVVFWAKNQKWVQEPSSNSYVTTCRLHKKSCHPHCSVKDKKDCCMMDSNGRCTVCSCSHEDHINADYVYVLKTTKERKSNWDSNSNMRTLYQNAQSKKSKSEQALNRATAELKKVEADIQKKLTIVATLKNELAKIALRPQLSTIGDFIDQLIENETNSPGRDAEKIKMLKDLKRRDLIQRRLDRFGEIAADDFKAVVKGVI